MYEYVKEALSSPVNSGDGTEDSFATAQQQHPQETTSLLQQQDDDESPPPSAQAFYFPPNNPTLQTYYRFTASPLTPFCALHKRPAVESNGGGVTGLLRRSAVLPSHGTDPTGEWVLVSVGGRSGWARKKQRVGETGFVPVQDFRATEGWMG